MNYFKKEPTVEDDIQVMPQANLQTEKNSQSNTTYLSIMEEIEAKELLRVQKENEYKEESKEIKLSDDKQAQVDNRKKELEAMIANMQKMESEFDDIQDDFDDELSLLL